MKNKIFPLTLIFFILIQITALCQTSNNDELIDDYTISNIDQNAVFPDIQTQTLPTRESQSNDIWIGGQQSGIMPLDIFYVASENKFFVYGYHRIVVLNGTTYQKEGVIDISDYGVSFPSQMNNLAIEDNGNFAYNPSKNELYCVTEDLKIIAIDPVSNQISYVIKQGVTNPVYDFKILKYDERTDKIFLVVSGFNMPTSEGTHYYTYYGTNYQSNTSKGLDFFTYSFAVNTQRNAVYFCIDKPDSNPHYIQIRTMDGNTVLNEQNVGDAPQGKLLYINDVNNNIHKVFSFPVEQAGNNYSKRFVIDGNTDNIQNYNISTFITSSVYNPDNNHIYCAYQGGVYVYDASTNNLTAQININPTTFYEKIFSLTYNGQNKIIAGLGDDFYRVSEGNGAIMIDCNDNSYNYISEIPNSFGVKATVNNSNVSLLISAADFSVSAISPTGTFLGKTVVGGKARKIVYNENENKVYSYEPKIGKIYVNDLTNNTSSIIDLGYLAYPAYISSVVFDKDRNRLYIAIYEDNNLIRIVDGTTDQIIQDEIHTQKNYVKKLFYGGGNKLYCTTGASPLRLEFVDLNNLTSYSFKILSSTINFRYSAWFASTKTNDIIVAVNNPGDATQKIRVVSSQNDNFIENYTVTDPIGLAYDPLNNKIYSGSIDDHGNRKKLTIINRYTGQISYRTFSKEFLDLQYCDKGNYIAVLTSGGFTSFNPTPSTVIYYDGKTDNLLEQFDVPSFATGIKYNKVNGNLYVLIGFHLGSLGHNRTEVWNINHFYGINSYVELNMYETHLYQYISSSEQAVINTNDNTMISTTSCHSKLNVVQCEDEKLKVDGNNTYTWISFPKLERNEIVDEQVSTQSVMENIDPLPNKLDLTYRKPPPDLNYVTFTKSGPVWNNIALPFVQSTKGYKLNIHDQAESWLHLYGTRLAPDFRMQLKAGGENWIGYFLLQNQSPLDALSQLLPNQLVSAKGHDWTLVDLASGPGNHVWSLTPEDAVIKYGDMVVVEVVNDINIFEWYGFGNVPNEVDRTPQQYSYQEKADYTSLLIEPDTANRPQEIGAFVNDTCIGACVVLPADTMVLLKSYDEGYNGDSITFQMFYGTKSAMAKKVDKYYVLNREKGVMEQRVVKTGENKKFHFISFNKPINNTRASRKTKLECLLFPNPVTVNSKLQFTLNQSAPVDIYLYSQTGKLMENYHLGNYNKGIYNVDLFKVMPINILEKQGLFLIKINAGNKMSIIKIIVPNNNLY